MKNKRNIITAVVAVIVALTICVVTFLNDDKNNDVEETSVSPSGMLTVHFLNVGQGDCTFIELPDGKCILIDAATYDYANIIINAIENNYGYSKIDYLVATHPHADHIGGMAEIVNHFSIGEIYMSKAATDTRTFENLLTSIKYKGLKINRAEADTIMISDNGVEAKFLSPGISEEYDDLNDYSAVLKIKYNNNSFLFTGDVEKKPEKVMLESYGNELDCDVLKVAHHGSDTSSTVDFINRVSPTYAVISCGKNNSYGHPHKQTLDRLQQCQATIYRTDKDGTVTIVCDGKGSFDIKTGDVIDLDN